MLACLHDESVHVFLTSRVTLVGHTASRLADERY